LTGKPGQQGNGPGQQGRRGARETYEREGSCDGGSNIERVGRGVREWFHSKLFGYALFLKGSCLYLRWTYDLIKISYFFIVLISRCLLSSLFAQMAIIFFGLAVSLVILSGRDGTGVGRRG
jgi:hypothetical protein